MTMLFPPDALPKGPPVDVKKALVLIDFQNDFVQTDGKLHVPNTSNFLPNLPTLVNKFRSKGSIIWVRTEFAQPRLTVSPETGFSSILLKQHLQERGDGGGYQPFHFPIQHDPEAFLDRSYPSNGARPCIPGTTGAEHPSILASTVDPKADMNVVKSDYSAFVETQLLLQLRMRLITHVYICGSLSNVSVYATVLDAVRHGLEVTLVEDCLGYLSPQCHLEAFRQMADDMGASGIDYQELMDDLSGLLGDVIREEDFSSRFQVSVPPMGGHPGRAAVPPSQRHQRVEEWIASAGPKRRPPTIETQGTSPKAADEQTSLSNESQPKTRTSKVSSKQGTPEPSPPRKRSTSDIEDIEEGFVPKLPPRSSSRRETPKSDSTRRMQKIKPRLRNTRSSQESSTRPQTSLKSQQSMSTGNIPDNSPSMYSDSDSQGPSLASPKPGAAALPQPKKQKKANTTKLILGPSDPIGEGDSRLVRNIVSPSEADDYFYALKRNVQWKKMYHRSGEVPRLVAVQGDASDCGKEIPIYRHPADESPELLPYDVNVDALRRITEKHVGHPLNHVLIQFYRSGEDNISEHSDKTLDIVRGSTIVNLSLGAQRTMTLRTKKVVHTTSTSSLDESIRPEPAPRKSQRIPLPHASLFLLGQSTNQHWLHSVRADKRPTSEKSPEELSFNSERISLTFRHIGTFINTESRMIWGEGATGKTKEEAKKILQGEEAQREGEKMIRAFGVENHSSKEWRWEEWYGEGFDVVDFEGHEIEVKGKE